MPDHQCPYTGNKECPTEHPTCAKSASTNINKSVIAHLHERLNWLLRIFHKVFIEPEMVSSFEHPTKQLGR